MRIDFIGKTSVVFHTDHLNEHFRKCLIFSIAALPHLQILLLIHEILLFLLGQSIAQRGPLRLDRFELTLDEFD